MAKSVFNFHSEVLGFHTTVHVLFPEPPDIGTFANGPFDEGMPVLYLLHGLRGGAHTWTSYTSIERYLHEAKKKLIVVMPEMGCDFYTDQKIGWKYFTYVAEELPRILQTFMRVTDLREKTYVGGLSMGGYGAMKMALTYPEKFGRVIVFSGALDIANGMLRAEKAVEDGTGTTAARDSIEMARIGEFIFGGAEAIPGTENDLLYLLQKASESGGPKPKMYISCGTADGLFAENLRFAQQAQKLGFDVTFHDEANEGHAWRFWDKEIEKQIRIFL